MRQNQGLLKKRDPYWDNVKGVLIILVVVTHFLPSSGKTISEAVWDVVYFFHMPLFIFVSGYFFKPIKVRERIIGLVLIGLSYNCLLILIDNIILGYEQTFYLLRATKIPWFVFCIAVCTLIAYLVKDCNSWMIILISLLLGCVACYDEQLMQFMTISKVVGWFPFFYGGYLLSQQVSSSRRDWKIACNQYVLKIIAGVLVTGYSLLILLTRNMKYGIFQWSFLVGCDCAFPNKDIVWLVIKVGYYIGICVISFGVLMLIPRRQVPLLTVMGQRTMRIYFWHIPVRTLVRITPLRVISGANLFGLTFWTIMGIAVAILTMQECFKFPTDYILKHVRKQQPRQEKI